MAADGVLVLQRRCSVKKQKLGAANPERFRPAFGNGARRGTSEVTSRHCFFHKHPHSPILCWPQSPL